MQLQSGQIELQAPATQTVDIPGTPLRVSRVALGTWAMGGWMWGGTDERESIATIRAALDQGINLIDTAPICGSGVSEEIVGRALGVAGLRSHMEMSTVSPSLSRRLHDRAREKEVLVLDAPVSGTTTVAERGELVIFVGGDRAVYERCLPVQQVLARDARYLGPAGSGTIMKLCVNTLLGLGMQAEIQAR